MLLGLYKTAMRLSTPLLESFLRKRAALGKEDVARAHERRGRPLRLRTAGQLVWFHAASVGESLSLLAVINRLLKDHPQAEVMVTTGTVTSAKLMADRLPPRAFHQYIPVDHPSWAKTFVDHWRPDLVIWAESEFWPNLLAEIRARRIPAVLLNARMSGESFRKWKFARGLIGGMLETFSLCLAQNEAEAERLTALGARRVEVSTNLKYAAAPLPFDETKLAGLQAAVGVRKTVLWASTHPGEEEIALRVHAKLKTTDPDLLTIVVPRHPARGIEVLQLAAGFGAGLRSQDAVMEKTEVYIADTLGELGLFYRLCKNVVMGGTFSSGGHNPIEPGQLGCVVFSGPLTYNFMTITEDFKNHGAIVLVKDEEELAVRLGEAFSAPARFASVGTAAAAWTQEKSHVVDEVAQVLEPLMKARAA